ncbi:MAG: winged helix-turn-helix transcriptional regulator, partial [Candidatus Helarchaeota archaeon]
MSKESNRYNSIKQLLKSNGGHYYKESIILLDEILKGTFQENPTLNNKIVANLLNISKEKASKILSNLTKNGLVKKSLEENNYIAPSPNQIESLFFEIFTRSMNKVINNLNNLFNKSLNATIYEKLNLLEGYK